LLMFSVKQDFQIENEPRGITAYEGFRLT